MRLARWLYLRGLAVVVLVAVVPLWLQLNGLIGSNGIWPAADQMKQLHAAEGLSFFDVPTLAWISASDGFLHFLCASCVVLAALLFAGIFPRLVLGLLWICWMSLVHVGGPFLSFQWDVLLIETLFFSIFFAPPGIRPKLATEPEPPAWSRFLLQFLAFKLTFSSGIVKLASGDPSWRDLTALSYHYWTQPLPTWTSYLAHQWPMFIHQLSCAVVFLCELPLALAALGPRKLRLASAVGMFTLQIALALAGNYSYFNLIAAVLCLPLLDDAALKLLAPRWKWPELSAPPPDLRLWKLRAGIALVVVYAVASTLAFFRGADVPVLRKALNAVYPFATINSYGAFAVMTKARGEIILEGSRDGLTWTPWEFDYKPGRVDHRPGFIAPYQPRLDWQMWFAALSACQNNPWILSLQWKLLQGSAPVRGLLATDPFADTPPKFIRSTIWDYRFASPEQKGIWWTRENPRPYCPPLMLDENGQLAAMALPPGG